MSLLIYKASAGSGKTFTLAVEYIKFLIENPLAYRHILAVTFTNKATAEMKERITEQLYGIWQGDKDSDGYVHELRKRLTHPRYTEDFIRAQAGRALQNILHDYSRFRVQTIDAFYQDVMRNLQRELNLTPGMVIELDNKKVVDKSVDGLIESLQRGDKVLGWVEDFIEEQIADGKRWDVTSDTKAFAKNLSNETYMALGQKQSEMLSQHPKLIGEYKKQLRAMSDEAAATMKTLGERFFRLIDDNGLSPADLSGKEKGISSYFNKLRNEAFTDSKIRNQTVEKHLQGAEAWCAQKSPRRDEIIGIAQSALLPLLEEAERKRPVCVTVANTCQISLRHLNKLQLLDSISRRVSEDNQEANRFMLSDTNALLHNLMQEGDANFIFEKIGANIKHVMIDEFQDTSTLQWDNFRLLFSNILAEGYDSLIVGDVKQSIYRWRGGDWNILNELGTREDAFKRHIQERTLGTNYRSEARVIGFNNALFRKALSYFRTLEPEEPEEEYQKLEHAYADVAQEVPPHKAREKGYVKLCMQTPEEDYAQETIERLGEEVRALLDAGIPEGQIAILLRSTTRLPDIAAYFENQLGIPLVSGEAFLLGASTAVCLLADALRLLSDPENKVAKASLDMNYRQLHPQAAEVPDLTDTDRLRQLPLYELIEELYGYFGLHEAGEQDAYLLYFIDQVAQYLADNPSDIENFLAYWDEELCQKAIPGGEVQNGIRVLTVHKAKGLQFHTVVVPFCDWTLEVSSQFQREHLLWCRSVDEAPYNSLEVIPLNYDRRMAQSLYNEAYQKERLQLWVDNLNTLYVALTRAEKNLVVLSKRTGNGKDGKKRDADTVGSLLEVCVPLLAEDGLGTWDDDKGTYTLGTLCTDTKRETQKTNKLSLPKQGRAVRMVSRQPQISFRQSNRSADFIAGLDEAESPRRFIHRGKLLHEVFSVIRTKDDVETAIASLVGEGVIGTQQEQADIRALAERALTLPEVQDWYDGTWHLYNEQDIIWMEHGELRNRRPDRVMEREGELVVIDFKFGQPRKEYHRQVQGYMNLLRGMAGNEGKRVSGYLWYVDNDKIERV